MQNLMCTSAESTVYHVPMYYLGQMFEIVYALCFNKKKISFWVCEGHHKIYPLGVRSIAHVINRLLTMHGRILVILTLESCCFKPTSSITNYVSNTMDKRAIELINQVDLR